MGVPVVYRKSSEAGVNYDFVDFSSGAGYVAYYLAKDQSAYLLVNSANIYSDKIVEAKELNQSVTKVFDQTFTITLNLPKVINGNVIANIAGGPANDTGIVTSYFIVKVIKIVNSAETTIAQATSSALAGTLLLNGKVFLVKIPVTNYLIKKGEQLGVRLEGYGQSVDPTGDYIQVGLDPRDRNPAVGDLPGGVTSIDITQSSVYFPFKIDL